jgi:hypothetical protein
MKDAFQLTRINVSFKKNQYLAKLTFRVERFLRHEKLKASQSKE